MKKTIFALSLLLGYSLPVLAQFEPNTGLQEYFSAQQTNQNKSIIYVFFNDEPCADCAQTIEMVENLYDREFINDFNLFLINYQNDAENNFINTYNLSQPLEVVLVRINDGAAFGYKKVTGLQELTSDPTSFDDYLSNQITDYLSADL